MAWLLAAVLVVALGAWLVALWSAFQMLRRRAPGRSVMAVLLDGMSFYTGRGFAAEAAPHHRRFLAAVAVIVLAGLAAVLVGLLGIPQGGPGD